MKNTERKIKELFENGYDYDSDALISIAEQLRVANLLKAKELGIQIPDRLIIEALVDEETANSIIEKTEELRLCMRDHR